MRSAKRGGLSGRLLAGVLVFAFLNVLALANAQEASFTNRIVGTWVLVGTPSEIGQPPAAGAALKIVTAGNWSDLQLDPETGATNFSHGGTWSIHGGIYTEIVTNTAKSTRPMLGRAFRFSSKLDGDTLTLVGKGNPWKELWKRVDFDSLLNSPKADASELQGSWSGKEKESKLSAALEIKGNRIEFREADDGEWYKGRFTVYDTKPKQLIVIISDCSDHDFVGAACNSIYQLENGTLKLGGYEPGDPVAPADFNASGVRTLEFRKR